ncbi:MAG TPA: patatin-like phospholipase family protein [Burkholderiaceae bacterium]|jgi:NTE family protein
MNPFQTKAARGREKPAPLPAATRAGARRLNLALQGGGAHGAFTWGVLDRLLEDPGLEFEGLSGSSAGAMNAVVMADGWLKGGRPGARRALASFWTEVGRLMPRGLVVQGGSEAIHLSAASKLLASWAGHFSPTQLNPFELNPLRDLLARRVDFKALRAGSPFKLFIAATQANTGKLRIFREHELTVEMLMASACLPKIHHPVDIDGEPYWDGGYSANPAIFPLFYECEADDILLVLLSPLRREDAPRTAKEIDARITELSFSATFMREMQTFARAAEFADPAIAPNGRLEAKLRDMRFHMVDVCKLSSLERIETRALAHAPFLELLREQGVERASAWLDDHADDVGERSSIDVQKWFG